MNSETEPLYDLAIIGGGIAGAGIARDASLRGAKVILFEQHQFGSGTSSKTSKLIHGGLRYLDIAWKALKKGDFREFWKNFCFVFLALHETHVLKKIAAGTVRPVSLIIPIYRQGKRNIWGVRVGAIIYGLMSLLSGGKHFPQIFWSKQSILKCVPELNPEGLLGGVLIWDHTTHDQTLTQQTMATAEADGATVFEQAHVTNYQYNHEQLHYEIEVTHEGETKTFRAHKLINAAGPWVDKLRQKVHDNEKQKLIAPVAGSHIEFRRFLQHSLILEAEDSRIFFVINRGERARVGTTEWIHEDPDTLQTPDSDVNYLLTELKKYFPNINLSEADIVHKDTGIRPLARPADATSPHDISREHEIHVSSMGVWYITGVKLTDHRRAAKEILDQMINQLQSQNPKIQTHSQTHKMPLKPRT